MQSPFFGGSDHFLHVCVITLHISSLLVYLPPSSHLALSLPLPLPPFPLLSPSSFLLFLSLFHIITFLLLPCYVLTSLPPVFLPPPLSPLLDSFRPGDRVGCIQKKSDQNESSALKALSLDSLRPFIPEYIQTVVKDGQSIHSYPLHTCTNCRVGVMPNGPLF